MQVVETFADPAQFNGTVYTAHGWQELGLTYGWSRCRVRNPKGLWILGMLRRVVISLFMPWRAGRPKPEHQSLTDFQAVMGEDNVRKAMAFLTSPCPKL